MDEIRSVELWLTECYGCKADKYTRLHDWFISLQLPLNQFYVRRIPLSTEWQKYAQGKKVPFVIIRGGANKLEVSVEELYQILSKGKDVNTIERIEKIRNDILHKQEAVEAVKEDKKSKKEKRTIVKKDKVVAK